jgi:hypothetical protein
MSEKSYNVHAIIIIFVVAIVGVLLINNNSFVMPTARTVYSSGFCEEVEVPYTTSETIIESLAVQDCLEKNLDYSMGKFQIISECLEFNDEQFCENKNVYFFLDILNKDDYEGEWIINFVLYGDDDVLSTKSKAISLKPKDGSRISVTFYVEGAENSNKVVSGEYFIRKDASRKICSGPITYRNETRVIKVTRFRTEIKCF